ncbi:hypothetical protein MSAN_02420500 [Mycena sanguinolenta]|uniref:Uncharacterized protein n=1 Tax=Mycena sanguinolenta TaxID=230812 RepID=A0A8H6X329_9AGAR|nr:hypothetical protein MSAN_02420500 [Mycena sanguinolenta]
MVVWKKEGKKRGAAAVTWLAQCGHLSLLTPTSSTPDASLRAVAIVIAVAFVAVVAFAFAFAIAVAIAFAVAFATAAVAVPVPTPVAAFSTAFLVTCCWSSRSPSSLISLSPLKSFVLFDFLTVHSGTGAVWTIETDGSPAPTHAPQLARPSSSSSPPPPTLAWHSPIQSPEYPHVLPCPRRPCTSWLPPPLLITARCGSNERVESPATHHAPRLPRPSSPPMPTLPFPRQFRHGGPEIEGMCPPRHPPLFRRPRSLATSPPTPTLPCPRRFRRGGPQIHGTCLPQYPLPHRCPAFSVAAAVAADFVVSLPIDLGLASNRREVSPTSASASSTPALNVPAAVAADFAIFSSIHLGCFLKPRDVSPAASTTSTTPALVVPATVAVDLAVSSLIHLGCFSDPRGVSPAAPTTSSTPSLAVAAAVAVDLAVVGLKLTGHLPHVALRRRRRRLSYFVADSAVVGLKLTGHLPHVALRFVYARPWWASNGRDVYPASASASSTAALVVPPPPLPTLVRLLKIFSVAADLAQPVESGTPPPLRPELTHRAPSSWPSATCGM